MLQVVVAGRRDAVQAVVDDKTAHEARVEVRGEGARALGCLAAAVEARSAGIHKVTAMSMKFVNRMRLYFTHPRCKKSLSRAHISTPV